MAPAAKPVVRDVPAASTSPERTLARDSRPPRRPPRLPCEPLRQQPPLGGVGGQRERAAVGGPGGLRVDQVPEQLGPGGVVEVVPLQRGQAPRSAAAAGPAGGSGARSLRGCAPPGTRPGRRRSPGWGSASTFHLASPEVGLDTHVLDFANVLGYKDLQDAVLVGHSYGGMVITGAAERAPSRLAQPPTPTTGRRQAGARADPHDEAHASPTSRPHAYRWGFARFKAAGGSASRRMTDSPTRRREARSSWVDNRASYLGSVVSPEGLEPPTSSP